MKYSIFFLCILLSVGISIFPAAPEYGFNADAGKYAEIGGIRIYYESYGQGDALLMLHGGLGSIADFKNSIGYLAKHFRVIAADTRGHGRSTQDGKPYSYALFAGDMIRLMDHLQVKRFHIIGFSDGTVTGYHLASKFPGRVITLTAVGGNYRVSGMTGETKNFVEKLMAPEAVAKHSFWTGFRDLHEKLNPVPGSFNAHVERSRKMWIDDPYISPGLFAAIKVPVLFVFGDRDAITFEHIIHMYRTLPAKTTHLCILPNAPHHVFLTSTALLNPIILDFLKK